VRRKRDLHPDGHADQSAACIGQHGQRKQHRVRPLPKQGQGPAVAQLVAGLTQVVEQQRAAQEHHPGVGQHHGGQLVEARLRTCLDPVQDLEEGDSGQKQDDEDEDGLGVARRLAQRLQADPHGVLLGLAAHGSSGRDRRLGSIVCGAPDLLSRSGVRNSLQDQAWVQAEACGKAFADERSRGMDERRERTPRRQAAERPCRSPVQAAGNEIESP
jgi:hypothetical protein